MLIVSVQVRLMKTLLMRRMTTILAPVNNMVYHIGPAPIEIPSSESGEKNGTKPKLNNLFERNVFSIQIFTRINELEILSSSDRVKNAASLPQCFRTGNN